eukprot:TRINITY_DN23765_c0_g1_i1.p1 TRINITY_DN23765_c0_g1~~TRINITY_DN23765_c0_g1_i1.p1  ORF type:complete len:637 (+),score=132.50 TRINITY_DN23765_c0_g1_i1:181-2091(+)
MGSPGSMSDVNCDILKMYETCREELIDSLSIAVATKSEGLRSCKEEVAEVAIVTDLYQQCQEEFVQHLSETSPSRSGRCSRLIPREVPVSYRTRYSKVQDELLLHLSLRPRLPRSLESQDASEETKDVYRKCRDDLLKSFPTWQNISNSVPGQLFARFLAASQPLEIQEVFGALLRAAGGVATATDACSPQRPHKLIREVALPWRAQALWKVIDEKEGAVKTVASTASSRERLRAVVIGGGPIGLRAALELSLAGHDVVVLEKRQSFGRINRVHLWDFCQLDLKSLGAKLFDQPGASFGANADYCHIGIDELQSMLMKVCLLLGVRLHFGSSYEGVEYMEAEAAGADRSGWHVSCRSGAQETLSSIPFDVLLGADGPSSVVAQTPELAPQFGRVEHGLSKGSAIGLVANFIGGAARSLRQFSLARQFAQQRFATAEIVTGVSLENFVYYRNGTQHYVIMTPTQRSLADKGIFIDPESEDLTSWRNVHHDRLREVAASVAAEFGLPALPFAERPNDAAVFDFSGIRRAKRSCAFLGDAPEDGEEVKGKRQAMALLVGDSLLEPFWPEGLGIARGILSVFDAVATVNTWSDSGCDPVAARAVASACFTSLGMLTGKTRDFVLKPDTTKFSVDPSSRYK